MERKKRAYTTPTIKVYPIQEDNLLQAASVTPNGNASGTTSWDTEQEQNGGELLIGDDSNVAPAKSWGNVWEEE